MFRVLQLNLCVALVYLAKGVTISGSLNNVSFWPRVLVPISRERIPGMREESLPPLRCPCRKLCIGRGYQIFEGTRLAVQVACTNRV